MGKGAKRLRRSGAFLKVLDGDFSKQLSIPTTFIENFNGESPSWLIIELAGTRKCWRVDLAYDGSGVPYFSDGWNDFVEENALEVGNFLVFEYKGQFILEVKMFDKDGSERTACQTSESVETPKTHRRKKASAFPTKTSLDITLACQLNAHERQQQVVDVKGKADGATIIKNGAGNSVVWTATNRFYYVTIPRKVAEENNLSATKEAILMDQAGNRWPVELWNGPHGCLNLTRGWREFLRESEIKVGDTLTLEFFPNKLIQVHIERPSPVDHAFESPNSLGNETIKSLDMAFEEAEHVEPAATFTPNCATPEALGDTARAHSGSENSSFSTKWTETAISRGSYLHIPLKVATAWKLVDQKKVVVCDPNGRTWELQVKVQKRDGRSVFTQGVAPFLRGNNISAGDHTIFRFVSDGMANVQILRGSPAHSAPNGAVVKQERVDYEELLTAQDFTVRNATPLSILQRSDTVNCQNLANSN